MHGDVLHDNAVNCLTGKVIHTCSTRQCKEPYHSKHAIKEWICFTCRRHLQAGNVPPQAIANGLDIDPVPEVLQNLSCLESQVVALSIPFMKLLSLPRGGQKGVKGQVVSVPSDLNNITKTLARTIDESQLVKVKLKRKLSYKGH